MKRDGSIAFVVKSGNIVEADEERAQKLIVDVFRDREKQLLKTFHTVPLESPSPLSRLSPEEISRLISTISKGKALSYLPIPDNILHLADSSRIERALTRYGIQASC